MSLALSYYKNKYRLQRFRIELVKKISAFEPVVHLSLAVIRFPFALKNILFNLKNDKELHAGFSRSNNHKYLDNTDCFIGKNSSRQEIFYQQWIIKNEPDEKELNDQKNNKFAYSPKISIISFAFRDSSVKIFTSMIRSIIAQTYENWELCIALGSRPNRSVSNLLDNFAANDKRIKVMHHENTKSNAVLINKTLNSAAGDYVTFINEGDLLAGQALFEMIKSINNSTYADIIYSDEDYIAKDNKQRSKPHFKPDYNPDMLKSCNYISNAFVCRTVPGNKAGWFRQSFDGAELYDLILRLTELTDNIIHIPKILYHKQSGLESNKKAFFSHNKALADHLNRVGIKGNVVNGLLPNTYKINYPIINNPLISIIILNKDHAEDLKRCVQSIIKKSSYKNIEIIIVENSSTDKNIFELYHRLKNKNHIKLLEWVKPFNFSAINNFAVNSTTGEILLFMNNDMEVINSNWLEEMLQHTLRNEVGAVGAKLYYPDGTIQHAGVVNYISHAHRHLPKDDPGYFGRAKVIQDFSIVTGACLMMRKEIFNEIGGFDKDFAISYNDFDLCLRLRKKGYLIVWTPYAELYHYESSTTKQYDNQVSMNAEAMLFRSRWKRIIKNGDPYFNPNLSDEFKILH